MQRTAGRTLIILTVGTASAFLAGCGGGTEEAEPTPERVPVRQAAPATQPAGPGAAADRGEVMDYLMGEWDVELFPNASVDGIQTPTVDLNVSDGGVTIAGVTGSDMALDVPADGTAWPKLSFLSDGFTTSGPTGEDVDVPGPIEWDAQLYRGELVGTATGPEGRSSRWTASKQ